MQVKRSIYRLTLRPEKHVTDHIKALRRLLKYALRVCGLRAISVKEDRADE
jgi:hypothetical protein